MSKFLCKCGHLLSNIGVPNEMEGTLKSLWNEDKEYSAWECEYCNRLWININNYCVSYRREDGLMEKIF